MRKQKTYNWKIPFLMPIDGVLIRRYTNSDTLYKVGDGLIIPTIGYAPNKYLQRNLAIIGFFGT
jgi:hypothetical protein